MRCRMAVISMGFFALTISSFGNFGIGRMLMYVIDSSAGIAGWNFLACAVARGVTCQRESAKRRRRRACER